MRLRGAGEDGFRGAMGELTACWFFKNHLNLIPRPPAEDPGRTADFVVDGSGREIVVEVKSPRRDAPMGTSWMGDDSDLLAGLIRKASKQLDRTNCNLVVLVTELRTPVVQLRRQLVTAALGETVWRVPVGPGAPSNAEFTMEIQHDGKFLKPWGNDHSVDHRRVGGVMCLEVRIRPKVGSTGVIPVASHRAVLVHNPHADIPLPEGIWEDVPQLVCQNGALQWTDGHPIGQ